MASGEIREDEKGPGGVSWTWAWIPAVNLTVPQVSLEPLLRRMRTMVPSPPKTAHQEAKQHDRSHQSMHQLQPMRMTSLKEQCLPGTQTHTGPEQSAKGLRVLGGQVEALLRPNGPCTPCDQDRLQSVLNVLTMQPFFALGAFHIARRRSKEGKMYGASLIGVGAAATAYHSAPHGSVRRRWMRRFDYWSIAISSACLNAALRSPTREDRPPNSAGSRLLLVTSLLAVPFLPFPCIAANAAAAETRFFRSAHLDERDNRDNKRVIGGWRDQTCAKATGSDLKSAHFRHTALTSAGTVAFFLEDACPDVKFLHTAWHCLSFGSLYTFNALLHHHDQSHAGAAAE